MEFLSTDLQPAPVRMLWYSCAASTRTCCKSIVSECCERMLLHMRRQAAPNCIFAVEASGKGDVCASCVCWL